MFEGPLQSAEIEGQEADLSVCGSLDGLIYNIQRRGVVQGSQKEYTAEEIEEQISSVLEAKRNGDTERAKEKLSEISGTLGLFEAVDRLTDKELETKEIHPSLSRFKKFLTVKKDEIQKRHDEGQSYADIFYDLFYSENFENDGTSADPRMLEEMVRVYNEEAEKTDKLLTEHTQFDETFVGRVNPGWIQFGINDGVDRKKEALSRFYMNLRPELAPALLRGLFELGISEGFRFEAKIAKETDSNEIKRYEQMVMYYPTIEHDKIIEFIARFHDQYARYFKDDIPEFASRVGHFETGQVLSGIGFAEDPKSGKSFGMVRTEILAELYEESLHEGINAADPRFRLGTRFRAKCREFGVDPKEPAFNLAA